MTRAYRKASAESRFWPKVNPDAETGCWNWTARRDRKGYGIFGMWPVNVLAHRFAWGVMIGPIPEGMQLDHICHNPSCVNPLHLRLATPAENSRNALMPVTNKSGFKGVCFEKQTRRWRAQITAHGKNINLGRFDSPELAHQTYCDAAHRLHGAFANEGFAIGISVGYVGGKL